MDTSSSALPANICIVVNEYRSLKRGTEYFNEMIFYCKTNNNFVNNVNFGLPEVNSESMSRRQSHLLRYQKKGHASSRLYYYSRVLDSRVLLASSCCIVCILAIRA